MVQWPRDPQIDLAKADLKGWFDVNRSSVSYGRQIEVLLEKIFSRDGVGWGVEIKNTWAYIDRREMETKIEMCSYMGLKPLFVMRWAPKSYVEMIRRAGGFGLLYETQYFPIGHTIAMERLRALGLPIESPTAVPESVFSRFVRWHEGGLGR